MTHVVSKKPNNVWPGRPTSFMVQIKSNPLSISAQTQYILPCPSLCLSSDQGTGIHPVWGDDVCLHHRAAALAGGWDDILLQEDLGSRRGSAERERVSNTLKHTNRASLPPSASPSFPDPAGPSRRFPPTASTLCFNLLCSVCFFSSLIWYLVLILTHWPWQPVFPFSPLYHSPSFRAEYLAVASESKDNCASVQVAE